MKLIKLTANKDSFHPVIFREGINIVVGKKTNPGNTVDGKTFNGVGKSLIIHLLHFCLCSNKIDTLEQKLPEWTFTLFFSHEDIEHKISRNTSKQNEIFLDGEKIKLNEARQRLLKYTVNEDVVISFRELLTSVLRRNRSSYDKYNRSDSRQDDYQSLLRIGFLLGLDAELIKRKHDLRTAQEALKKTESAFKKDPIFREYYCGTSDAQLDADELECEIDRVKTELAAFKVSSNYHEIENQANELSFAKKRLENEISVLENNIKNIYAALNIQADMSVQSVVQMYEAATIEVPEMLKKSLNDVELFHTSLVQTREIRLKGELRRIEEELQVKVKALESLGTKMDQLLAYLNTHGALEEYSAINSQLTDLMVKLNHIKEYQNMLRAFQTKLNDLKDELTLENRRAEAYLDDSEEKLKALRKQYREMTKKFYPKKKSGLVVENNTGENQLRFNIDARIEDDSSDGVNEVKIFCFDFLLLLQKTTNFEFLFHDSRLLANMDPRQRTMLYRVAYDLCKENGFQYITTINEDALKTIKEAMEPEEYREIIDEGIILTLKDDSANSKLLGVQVDMDLEN